MNQNIDYKRLRNTVIEADYLKNAGGGWLVYVEAAVVGYLAFKRWDNALIALGVFFVAAMLLANRVTGTIIALAFGGAVGFVAYQYAMNASGRWDVGAAAAIVAAFFGFCFQHVHVEAFEKFQ